MEFYPSFSWHEIETLDKRPLVTAPENLVFSGGGIKGLAYLGVIKALEEKNLSARKIHKISGAYTVDLM